MEMSRPIRLVSRDVHTDGGIIHLFLQIPVFGLEENRFFDKLVFQLSEYFLYTGGGKYKRNIVFSLFSNEYFIWIHFEHVLQVYKDSKTNVN